jgi:hypothetical protein
MKTNQQKSQSSVLRTSGLITLAAIILLGCAQGALAQTQWTTNGNDIYKTNSTGNVGIGTQTPTGQLHIGGSSSAIDVSDGAASIFRINTNVTAPAGYDIYALKFYPTFTRAGSGTHSYFVGVNIQPPTISGSGASITNAVSLYVGGAPSGATNNYAFWVGGGNARFDGNVGIGTATSNSNYKLDINGDTNVTGNIHVTGNINAKFQDVAEWVPSSEQLCAGTVVVLDSTKSNQVIASTVSYDTRVAGVISEKPGIALGEKGESKVLVATTGRVQVKVDATRAPIHIGDLLVTSDVPGVAMKSEPVNLGGVQLHRPGTLIGKALEPLEKGSGTILVLLSLQ